MKPFALFFLLALNVLPTFADPPVAMQDGEALRYRVRWGIFGHAGEIVVAAEQGETAGLPQIRISTHTKTRGLIRGLYLFDGDGECVFDARDGRLLAIRAWSNTSKKATKTMAVFDYNEKLVNYVDFIRPERNAELPLPEGNAMDLITSLIGTRRWDMKPGQRIPATVMFDKDFYELEIVAGDYETVETPLGTFKTLVLIPTMEKNPKGMFKRGATVRVWISQDEQRLPVKFEVGMKWGTGTALLSEYQPPLKGDQVANANPSP